MLMLVQFLCPSRHAILAGAYERGNGSFLECCDALEAMVGPNGAFKRQCMLCGSRDLHFEETELPFRTMQEAMPHLLTVQAANIASRRQLDAEGKTLEKLL